MKIIILSITLFVQVSYAASLDAYKAIIDDKKFQHQVNGKIVNKIELDGIALCESECFKFIVSVGHGKDTKTIDVFTHKNPSTGLISVKLK